MTSVCTCGNPHEHVIARRVTADGKHVLAWDDGTLTWALGYAIRGSAHPRTPEARERARQAARLVLEDVCLFDADEVPALIKAARWAAEKGTGRAGMLERLQGPQRGRVAGLKPQWTVYHADRDGRPTVRLWRLPRLTFPALVVAYEVLREAPRVRHPPPYGLSISDAARARGAAADPAHPVNFLHFRC